MENENVTRKILFEITKTEKLIEDYTELTQLIDYECAIGRFS